MEKFKMPEIGKNMTAIEWGDDIIVIDPSHIAICSDKRNRRGVPYIIHHSPLGAVEADELYLYEITAHYRFTSEGIGQDSP